MKNLRNGIRLLTSASVVSLVLAFPAAAQEKASGGEEREASSPVEGEIIVTANKREQNLNKVGLSIAALNGSDLTAQRITSVADLAKVVPGLVFAPSQSGTPVYTLRGIGFFESSLAAYPSVSVYLDQVPLSFPAMTTLTAFDLERVEVLKGPQGTLFGNNATGGAINFVASKPTDHLTAGVDLSYGRFNTVDVAGYISGPLSNTLTARAAFKVTKGDDWQRSYSRNDTLGAVNNVAGRLLLDWKPTDRLKFELNINGWRDRSDPLGTQKVGNTPQNQLGSTGAGGTVPDRLPALDFPVSPRDPRAAEWDPDFRPFANHHFWQTALRTDYAVTDSITATAITSYAKLRFLNSTEGDGTPFKVYDLASDDGRIKTFSQELRLSNGAARGFRWVLGGNYERSTVDEVVDFMYYDTTSYYHNGISRNSFASFQKMRNTAIFGNVEWDLGDKFTLKGGIRQTWAHRTSSNITYQPLGLVVPPSVNGLFPGPDTLIQLFGVVIPAFGNPNAKPLKPGDTVSVDNRKNPDGTPVDPVTYGTAGVFNGKLDEKNTSFSIGADFKPSDDVLLYGLVSRGFKAGSFPTLSAAVWEAYLPVVQESLTSYELGFKSKFMNNRVTLNGAAFYYDYNNKQLKAKFIDPIFGSLDKLLNIPKSRLWGAEAQLGVFPTEGLRLSGSITYLDAKIRRYDGVLGGAVDPATGFNIPVIASFANVTLPFSPKWQYSARVDYSFPISNSIGGFFGLGLAGQSGTIGILTVSQAERDLYRIDGYATVNGNIGIESADKSWRAQLWGKNIFNKYYWTNATQGYDLVMRYPARGAEYGISVSYHFK